MRHLGWGRGTLGVESQVCPMKGVKDRFGDAYEVLGSQQKDSAWDLQ